MDKAGEHNSGLEFRLKADKAGKESYQRNTFQLTQQINHHEVLLCSMVRVDECFTGVWETRVRFQGGAMSSLGPQARPFMVLPTYVATRRPWSDSPCPRPEPRKSMGLRHEGASSVKFFAKPKK